MRTLAAATTSASESAITQPVFLVEMGFNTPVLFSSKGNVTVGADTFVEASLKVKTGDSATVEVFNESTQFGQIVLTEGTAGRSIRIWQFYDASDVIEIFNGEMSEATIADSVQIRCKRRPPNRTPRDFISEPVFKHLPTPGTKINTPTQIITLE